MCAAKEYNFSSEQGVDWSKYAQYRPIYPRSFFEKIFNYHAQKPAAQWLTAHDVGAGAGIVSGGLSDRFEKVVVSDPNEDFLPLARKALIDEAGLPAGTFTFLHEDAEHSTVGSGSADLITACECIHWTDIPVALEEFHRQLKVGGSLVISSYSRVRLHENAAAAKAFDDLFQLLAHGWTDEAVKHALRVVNSGLTSLEFPEDRWTSVQRLYINARGSVDTFNNTGGDVDESKTKPSEEEVWQENDEGWTDSQGFAWLKEYVSTWLPNLPESDLQQTWNDLEAALGQGKTKMSTPIVMIFATKK